MTPPPPYCKTPGTFRRVPGVSLRRRAKKGPGLPGGGEAGAFAHALGGAARRSQAAVEEATSEEAASEDAASLETSDAASEDAASLAASEEALFSSATAEVEAASEVEAAVEEELPQAVMLTARTKAATVTQTFLSFISKISSYLKIVSRKAVQVKPFREKIF